MSTARGQGRSPAGRAPRRGGILRDPPRSGLRFQSLSSSPAPGPPAALRPSLTRRSRPLYDSSADARLLSAAARPLSAAMATPPWRRRDVGAQRQGAGARPEAAPSGNALRRRGRDPLSPAGPFVYCGELPGLLLGGRSVPARPGPGHPDGPRSPLPSAPRRLVFSS